MTNMLIYSIAREWLDGDVEGERFSLRAWSGGGRGRTGPGAEHAVASYDVFRRTQHEKIDVHGGPLPPGLYVCRYVQNHPHFHECIFLEQTITALIRVDANAHMRFYDRSGFYIHGRGPHGSDGCIVPDSEADRRRLNRAVKDAASAVLLKVTEPGMPLPATRSTSVSYA